MMVVGGLVLGVEVVGMVTGADRRTGRKELAGACHQKYAHKNVSLLFLKANHSRMIALDNQANKQMTCHFNCHFNTMFCPLETSSRIQLLDRPKPSYYQLQHLLKLLC